MATSQSKMPPQEADCLLDRLDGGGDVRAHGTLLRLGKRAFPLKRTTAEVNRNPPGAAVGTLPCSRPA